MVTFVFTPNTRIKSSEVNQDFIDTENNITTLTNDKPILLNRQGGSSSDWSVAGASNYVVTDVVIQCGVVSCAFGITAVTFPVAFTQIPTVTATQIGIMHGNNTNVGTVSSVSATGFSIQHYFWTEPAHNFHWIAIGK